jgi:hypothetical protein
MNYLLKTTAIFFSSLLFFVNIITDNYCLEAYSKTLNSGQESLSAHPPFENLGQFLSSRHGERLISTIKNHPVFNARNQTEDTQSKSIFCDPDNPGISPEYLNFSVTISRNLTISDIVFPFHYFW